MIYARTRNAVADSPCANSHHPRKNFKGNDDSTGHPCDLLLGVEEAYPHLAEEVGTLDDADMTFVRVYEDPSRY